MGCGCSTMKRHGLYLREVTQESDHTYSFRFDSEEAIRWKEGDSSKLFVQVSGREMGKKFSHATIYEEGDVVFTTRIRPECSEYKDSLSRLKVGDRVEISAPAGEFTLKRERRPIVLLSNGVGIAAVRSLIKSFEKDGDGIPFMLQLNVDRGGHVYQEEFNRLEEENAKFKSVFVEGRDTFYRTLDHELQTVMESFVQEPLLYVVGGDGFVLETIQHLHLVGFENDAIMTDGLSSTGGCGCSSGGGCGCGGDKLTNIAVRYDA